MEKGRIEVIVEVIGRFLVGTLRYLVAFIVLLLVIGLLAWVLVLLFGEDYSNVPDKTPGIYEFIEYTTFIMLIGLAVIGGLIILVVVGSVIRNKSKQPNYP